MRWSNKNFPHNKTIQYPDMMSRVIGFMEFRLKLYAVISDDAEIFIGFCSVS